MQMHLSGPISKLHKTHFILGPSDGGEIKLFPRKKSEFKYAQRNTSLLLMGRHNLSLPPW